MSEYDQLNLKQVLKEICTLFTHSGQQHVLVPMLTEIEFNNRKQMRKGVHRFKYHRLRIVNKLQTKKSYRMP